MSQQCGLDQQCGDCQGGRHVPAVSASAQTSVLHVITDTNRRGAQVFACDLSVTLAQRHGNAHRVLALAPGDRGAQLSVPVLGSGARSVDTLAALREEVRRSDIVVAHGSHTLLATAIAGVGRGPRFVYRNISDPKYWLNSRGRRARVRLYLGRMDHVVSLWSGGATYLETALRIPASKLTVIPNGVDTAAFRPPTEAERMDARKHFSLPAETDVLLYVAAMKPEKHPRTAVAALRHLPDSTHLLMVGDGPLRDDVRRYAEREAPGRVTMTGQIEDVLAAYWASDMLVLPTEGEGLPGVLIEGGLCGRPAAASTSGGSADIVRDGETGVTVPPADAPALAAAVRRVLDARHEWGEQARLHCLSRYSMTTVADQWQGVLTQVLGHTEAGRR